MIRLAKTFDEAFLAHHQIHSEVGQMLREYEALPGGGQERKLLMRKMKKKEVRMNVLFEHMMSF